MLYVYKCFHSSVIQHKCIKALAKMTSKSHEASTLHKDRQVPKEY